MGLNFGHLANYLFIFICSLSMGCGSIIFILVVGVLLFILFKPKQENMTYLDQYEMQDNYKNVPESWPIPYTSTTGLYAAKRKYLDEDLGRQCSSC